MDGDSSVIPEPTRCPTTEMASKVTCRPFTICVVVSKQMHFPVICIMRRSDSMKKNDDDDDDDDEDEASYR